MREPRRPTRRRWPWLLLYAGGVVLLALGIVYWRLTRPTGFDQFEKKILQETNPIMERRAVRIAPRFPLHAKKAPAPPYAPPVALQPRSDEGSARVWKTRRLDAIIQRGRATMYCIPPRPSLQEPIDLVHWAYHSLPWNPAWEGSPSDIRACIPAIDSHSRFELWVQDSGNNHADPYGDPETSLLIALAIRRDVLNGDTERAERLVLLLVDRLLKHESLPTTDIYKQPYALPEAGTFAWLGTHPGIDPRVLAQAQALLVQGRRSEEELRAHRVARILARKQEFEDCMSAPDSRGARVQNLFHFILGGWPERATQALMQPIALRALEQASRAAIEMDAPQEARGERRLLAALAASNISPPDGPPAGLTMWIDPDLEARFDNSNFKRLAAHRYDLDLSPAYNATVDYLAFVLACSRYQLEHGALPADPHDLVPDFLPESWWVDVTSYAQLDIVHVPGFQSMHWWGARDIQDATNQFVCATGRSPQSPGELEPYLPKGVDATILTELSTPVPEQDVLIFQLLPGPAQPPLGELNSQFPDWFERAYLVRQPDEHDEALDRALMAPAE